MAVRPVDRRQGANRRGLNLAGAAREFVRHPTPWLLGATLVAAVAARVLVGGWRVGDLAVPLVMLALFPFTEWGIHVAILHRRPRRIGPVTLDSLLARKHREHHANPRDLPLVFIPWPVLVWLVPALTAVALLAFPRVGLGLTFLVGITALGLGYEWTHYLIHTDYRPRGRLYRAVWHNHRLHHFRNEHYWFTVTSSGTADRVLGTFPDPDRTPVSRTSKRLHGVDVG